MEDKTRNYFLLNLFLIILVGIVLLFSSSYIYAKETLGSSYYFIGKHAVFLFIGGAACFLLSKSKFNFWFKHAYKFNALVILLLMATFIPGLGLSLKGANRWISFGFGTIQPSEFVKITLLLSSIHFFDRFDSYTRNDKLIYSLNLVLPLIVLICQPDFGSFAICSAIIFVTAYLSNFSRKIFYSSFAIGLLCSVLILIAAPYRVKRLTTFLDPWKDPQNSGFQIIQSYLAFANGHIFGQGIGNSHEKLFYLPEAYNDFIFSVAGEEVGFVGVSFIVFLFMSFSFWGVKLALKTSNIIHRVFISCLVLLISLQAFLNMGVVLGLLPTKG